MYLEYFKNIDTKDKAYWLGLLFADGSVAERRIALCFNVQDKWFLEKAARSFDKYCFFLREGVNKYEINLNSIKMRADVIAHGCVPRKTKVIELPVLDSRDLYLAFILGFFDGDGTQHKTMITCGSKKFLEQIKEMFHLPFKIIEEITDKPICGKPSHAITYRIFLGADLFNEIMDNYADSLPRKRRHFNTNIERFERIKQSAWKGAHNKKFDISKEELERLVKEMPAEHIAEKYGVSGSLITKRCR